MKKFIGLLALAAFLVGCQNTPQPTLNLYAPYGSPRVPPPATGAYGSPNTYYPQTNAPPSLGARGASSPIHAASARAESTAAQGQTPSVGGGKLRWRAIGSAAAPVSDGSSNRETAPAATAKPLGRVALAGFTKPIGNANRNKVDNSRRKVENGDVVNIVEQVVPSGTKLKLKGMALNDLAAPATVAATANPASSIPTFHPPQAIIAARADTPVRSITVSAVPTGAPQTSVEIGQLPLPRLRLRGLTPSPKSGALPITPAATAPASGSPPKQDDATAAEVPKAPSSPPGRLIPASMALPSKSVLRDNRSLATRFETPAASLDWKSR